MEIGAKLHAYFWVQVEWGNYFVGIQKKMSIYKYVVDFRHLPERLGQIEKSGRQAWFSAVLWVCVSLA